MNVVLILAVVVVSGVVAYIGDIIGKRLGKKRVTLFGLRPRQTAVLIAVVTGCLITIGTICAVALASNSARVALFHLDELYAQIASAEEAVREARESAATAQRDRQAALDDLESSEASLAETQEGLARASEAREEALVRAEQAAATAQGAEQEAAAARSELGQATTQVGELRRQQEQLQGDIQGLEEARAEAEGQRDALVVEAGRQHFEGSLPLFGYRSDLPAQLVALQPDRELARITLAQRTDSGSAIRALYGLLEDTTRVAQAAGTASYDFPGDGVDATTGLDLILLGAELQPRDDWHFYDLAERNQAYDAYLNRIATRAADLSQRGEVYILSRVGPYAVPRNRPAIITFELGLVESARLPVGTVLATEVVTIGTERDDVAQACYRLVSMARERARGGTEPGGTYRGVINPQLIPDPTYSMIEGTVAEVRRLHGDLSLDARLACIIIADPTWDASEGDRGYLNTDVPLYRIDVQPAL
ncbi:MAG: DUF3084 domain-containing protein [Armatimonadetes bacterium]|jgi:Skp family chaperone for outer membrane proteins|nr:DUF3084 domain-containing protein [Armatimonadota bacterium]MDI9600928.1 DUF3084 domain-containing protein [Acidobacteriota bacterium]